MRNKGDRVGAIISADGKTVNFLGYGVYVGDEIPPSYASGLNVGLPNPRINLDSGSVVFGCECWWGSEEDVERQLKNYETVNLVDIESYRKHKGV